MTRRIGPATGELPKGASMRPISVLLVDDNRVFLDVLSPFLEEASEGAVRVVGVVSEGREAIGHATAAQPDVILLDLKMPDVSGVVILPELREQLPHAIIVVLTMLEQEHVRQAALAEGADGFVTKSKLASDLLPTIRGLVSFKHGSA